MKKALVLLAASEQVKAYDVMKDCGAVPTLGTSVTLEDTFNNAKAFVDCFEKAQNDPNDRTVVVPRGHIFETMAVDLYNLNDITFTIDGVWMPSPYWEQWPLYADENKCLPLFQVNDSENFNIDGQGTVEGNGYDWWVREWNHQNKHKRPDLLRFNRVQTSEIQGVAWRNSPNFHLHLIDVDSFYLHDFEIYVDILKQQEIMSGSSSDDFTEAPTIFDLLLTRDLSKLYKSLVGTKTLLSLPTMPLNTDGIDPYGSNITIRNVNFTNFDDAVAIKPMHAGGEYKVGKGNCTQDILVENCNVKFGVGMSIGSVYPNKNHACVKNVTFRNINFEYPLKAIYIKSSPGTPGEPETGEITNILYENIKIHFPVWFAIYIGPQQMKEPDGGGPGCMAYPFQDCPTEPKIDFRNITIRNLESTGGLLPPGIIRFNESNPIPDLVFENVQLHGWWESLGWGFITEYAHGTTDNVYPDPGFGTRQTEQVFHLFSVKSMLKFAQQLTSYYKTNENDITAWEVLLGFVIWAVDYVV